MHERVKLEILKTTISQVKLNYLHDTKFPALQKQSSISYPLSPNIMTFNSTFFLDEDIFFFLNLEMNIQNINA